MYQVVIVEDEFFVRLVFYDVMYFSTFFAKRSTAALILSSCRIFVYNTFYYFPLISSSF